MADVTLKLEHFLIDEHTFEIDGKEYSIVQEGTKVSSNVADKIIEQSQKPENPNVVKVEKSEANQDD